MTAGILSTAISTCIPHDFMPDIKSRETRIDGDQGRLFAKRWDPVEQDTAAHSPLILLHDSLGSVELWRDLPEHLALALARPVITYDRLGFGKSDPHPGVLGVDFIRDEAITGFRDLKAALGFGRFAAFGHSVGGGMAVGIAAAYPDECEALVTMSAQAFVEDRTLAGIRAARQAFAEPGQVDRLRRYHGDKAPWVLAAWIDRWLAPEFAGWNLDRELPRVRCANLVLHGNHDEYGSVRHPQRIAELATGPSTLHIGDWGHVPYREDPLAVVRLVRDWFADHAAASD